MWQEFKEFISRGDVISFAVGLIMGTAFSKIVTSLVNDILMPPVGLLLGEVNFSNLFINLSGQSYSSLEQAQAAGAPTLNYGVFSNTIIEFIIIALAIFLLVRQVNRLKSRFETPAAEPATRACPYCTLSISVNATRCPFCTSELAAASKRSEILFLERSIP